MLRNIRALTVVSEKWTVVQIKSKPEFTDLGTCTPTLPVHASIYYNAWCGDAVMPMKWDFAAACTKRLKQTLNMLDCPVAFTLPRHFIEIMFMNLPVCFSKIGLMQQKKAPESVDVSSCFRSEVGLKSVCTNVREWRGVCNLKRAFYWDHPQNAPPTCFRARGFGLLFQFFPSFDRETSQGHSEWHSKSSVVLHVLHKTGSWLVKNGAVERVQPCKFSI